MKEFHTRDRGCENFDMWLRLLKEWVYEPNCLFELILEITLSLVGISFRISRNLYLICGPGSFSSVRKISNKAAFFQWLLMWMWSPTKWQQPPPLPILLLLLRRIRLLLRQRRLPLRGWRLLMSKGHSLMLTGIGKLGNKEIRKAKCSRIRSGQFRAKLHTSVEKKMFTGLIEYKSCLK